jgi:hypothetical protein
MNTLNKPNKYANVSNKMLINRKLTGHVLNAKKKMPTALSFVGLAVSYAEFNYLIENKYKKLFTYQFRLYIVTAVIYSYLVYLTNYLLVI